MKFFTRPIIAGLYLAQLLVPLHSEPSGNPQIIPSLNDVHLEGESVILELSQMMAYDVFSLESPWRLVIEIPETQYKASFSKKDVSSSLVKRIRGYQFKENPLISRIILDLKSPVDYKATANGNQVIISLKKNEILEKQAKETGGAKKTVVAKKAKITDLLQSLPTEVVSLDFESADIKDVIRLMAETSNINIIFGPEVAGTIAVHLKKVPFDEAFRTILNLKGLVASQLGTNILRVTTPDILARDRAKAVTFTKNIPVNYLKATDMQAHLQSVMASSGRKGTITVVTESNSLVVTDTEEGLEQAQRLVASLDTRPKQVMIEARIVEINIDNGFDMGVQWEFGNLNSKKSNDFNFIGTGEFNTETKSTGRVPWVVTDGAGNVHNFGANGPGQAGTGVNLAGPASAGITFGFVKNNQILSATLAALITQQKGKILSSPKVVTINGQQAKIQAVSDIPFRTAVVAANGTTSESFTTVSAGIVLTVTPTINAENRVTLVIKPESSIPGDPLFEGGNPVIKKRDAQTTVIVKDGDTLVIGGLINDVDTKTVSKVPLLGDIPIIGVFFRHNKDSKTRSELLVFVTPRIIRD